MGSRQPRVALRFLARSLTQRGTSFLLSLLAVTTAAAVTATMMNLETGLDAKMSKELRRYGPNLLVTPKTDGTLAGAPGGSTAAAPGGTGTSGGTIGRTYPAAAGGALATLDEAAVRALPARLPANVSLSPLLLASGTVALGRTGGPASHETQAAEPGAAATMRRGGLPATVVGCDFGAIHDQNPTWRTEGAWPRAGERACVIGASLAQRAGVTLAKPPVGSTVTPSSSSASAGVPVPDDRGSGAWVTVWQGDAQNEDGLPLRVAGIVSTGESADEQVFVPLALAQSAAGLSGRVSLAALVVEGGAEGVEAAAREVEAALPGSEAVPLRQIAAAQGAILAKLRRMMGLLTAAVLVLSALCLSTTLMSIVIERESEIGLMRSIGAGDRDVLTMFVGEVCLLGVAGGVLGLGAAALAARWIGLRLFAAPIDPSLSVVPAVLGASVALCLLSVLLPIRRAMWIQPAAALRGE